MSQESQPSLSESRVKKIQAHADAICAFPDEAFHVGELNEALTRVFYEFQQSPVLIKKKQESVGRPGKRHFATHWTINEQAREIAHDYVDGREVICPCGHGGLHNRGGHYVCGRDICDRTFDRDELEGDR